jgi:PAS domain S-box-containing protein
MMKKEKKAVKDKKIKKESLLEIEDLRIRLEEAEETLVAIRRGEVDGLVVVGPGGDQVFTLKGAERSYRFFVEAMNEGAVTLSSDGTVLYCNDRFAEIVETPYQKIIGDSIYHFVSSPDAFETAFQKGKAERSKTETFLKRKNNDLVPVSLSFNPMQEEEVPGVCMVVTDLTEHMHKDEVLKESETRLKDLSSKLLAAQEEERNRIAHEIHDALGSLLGGLRFKAENLLGQIGKNNDMEDLIRFIQMASDEARRIQSALHPPLLDDLGILATISWFSREFQKTYSGIRIENQINIQENDIPDPVKIVIYRIAQEALNNIAKHSKADLVHFSLRKIDKIELLIRDNGQGFKLDEKLSLDGSRRGIGLSSMKERTELSGGSFEIESSVGKGTIVRATWPI